MSKPAGIYTPLLITPTHIRSAVQFAAQNTDVCVVPVVVIVQKTSYLVEFPKLHEG